MRTKAALVIGFGAGYVLGARAGRQRYEQIQRLWGQFMGMPVVQRTAERTREAASEGAKRGLSLVQHGVGRAGGAVRERLSGDEPTDDLINSLERGDGQPPDSEQPDGPSEAFHPNQ